MKRTAEAIAKGVATRKRNARRKRLLDEAVPGWVAKEKPQRTNVRRAASGLGIQLIEMGLRILKEEAR
jgi:hypothetical protein